jgi:ribosomal protein L12E/L44/L45/RPP1/RPP2
VIAPEFTRPIAIDLRDRERFPFMRGIVLMAGVIVEDQASGVRVRVLPDGSLEELLAGGHPRPGAAHATARRP